MKDLQSFARALRAELGDGVIALGLEADEPQLFVTVSDDLVTRGVSAGSACQPRRPCFRRPWRRTSGDGAGPRNRRDRLPSALTAIREGLEQMLRDESRSADGSTAAGNGPA